jgi:hypothetical protein
VKDAKDVKNDRDSSMGRLLAKTLAARAEAVSQGACLDAETLAAWADYSLDGRQRATVEAHAADCARCQTLMAALVKTMPPPSTERSAWRMPTLGWLIPVTAAAAALVIWVLVPGRAPLPQPGSQAPVDQLTPAPTPAPAAGAEARLQAPAQPPRRDDKKRKAAAPEKQRAATLEKSEDAALDKRASASARAKTLTETAETATVGGAARGATPPVAGPVPAPPAPVSAARAFALDVNNASPGIVIVSSNPATRWRIVPGGAVERSADGGSTWQRQDTGVTVTLAAGASPSPSVCWLVGPGGTVVRSTGSASPFPSRRR